ncbi:hypothetical protein QFZ22_000056 [Streptomyces canus]|uniref:Lipoprotein n=1 Tax=Streptomyces canus TaxID=58343 RepID=A0AAW8F1Z0_9ACTN|nr:hypothetical protein [Streptomyces canus]MDQ0904071.1 hypothetical protein [Streptomyces canus]
MLSPRSWIAAPMMVIAMMTAGCSGTADPGADSHAAAPSTSATASPSPSPTSAFCVDLTPFRVVVVVYRGELADAVHSRVAHRSASKRQLDLKGLRQRAAVIARMGEEMQASAPPDIAKQFHTVLGAIRLSSSKLNPDSQLGDVVDPVFNEKVNPSFDAVDKYDCGAKDK